MDSILYSIPHPPSLAGPRLIQKLLANLLKIVLFPRFGKYWRKTALIGCFVAVWTLFPDLDAQAMQPFRARKSAPSSAQLLVGMTAGEGIGLQLGVASARTLYVRELVLISRFSPPILYFSNDLRRRIAVLPGIAIRVFGFERLIGNVAYRGYDVDVGLRAGPGYSFSRNDSPGDKDKRFEFLADPFVRFSKATDGKLSMYAEVGATQPSFRVGVWIPY